MDATRIQTKQHLVNKYLENRPYWRNQANRESWERTGANMQRIDALANLPDDVTPDQVQAIIGADPVLQNRCDECQRDVDVTIRLGDEPNYDSATVYLCADCLKQALALVAVTQ